MSACGADWRTSRWALLTVVLILGIAALVVVVVAGADLGLHSRYTADSTSMQPTIRQGSEIWARPVHGADVRAGEIVVMRRPTTQDISESVVIIRVVAVAGQSVDARNGTLLVDGRASGQAPPLPKATLPLLVPAGMVYVLGDNRANSLGSNDYGPVAVDQIIRMVVRINAPTTAVLRTWLLVGLLVAVGAALVLWRMRRRTA